MTRSLFKINSKSLFIIIFLIFSVTVLTQASFAQKSSDPDDPVFLREGVIEGSSAGGLSNEKTYYFAFDVSKGTLNLTLDVTPVNKSDGGGIVQWTLMNPKFEKLKYDVLAAQGSPERQVEEMPVTVKRRIIMKIVVSGNINYKFKLEGSAVSFAK